MTKKMTKEEFIKKAHLKHGNKFLYEKSDLENRDEKGRIIITCPIHGDFLQTPGSHIAGRGCNLCSKPVFDTKSFIKEAKKIYGDKYDYSKSEYVDSHTKLCVSCKKHGDFFISPNNHLRGKGCKKCANEYNANKCRLSISEFIEKSKKIHGNKYDYSKVEYINNSKKVCITCPEHGEFWQTPGHHMLGEGCPICNESKLEKKVRELLTKNSIEFEKEYSPKWAGNFRYDFFIPSKKLLIECQGYHHYFPVFYSTKENGIKAYLKRIESDAMKKILSDENGLKIIYFTDEKLKQNTEITDENALLSEIISTN